ncbi:MAG: hypothetical protein AB7T06_33055 [Kofleriaceae bacterium]
MTPDATSTAASLRERLRAIAEAERRAREVEAEPRPSESEAAAPMPVSEPAFEPIPAPTRSEPAPPLVVAEAESAPLPRSKPAPPPPVAPRSKPVMALLARVLGHLVAGRIEDAKDAWDQAERCETSTPDEYTRWLLVRELIAVARLVEKELVVIIARAIVRNALSSTHEPLLEYARRDRTRARTEADVLRTYAPAISRLVDDAMLDDMPRVERRVRRDADPPEKSGSSFWMFAALIVGVCLLVATIGVIMRPRTMARSPAFKATPTEHVPRPTIAYERPMGERDLESRVASLYAIRRSIDILAKNRWSADPALFDAVIDAVIRRDCAPAMRGLRLLGVTDDAPEVAREHVDSIRSRVSRVCANEKSTPVE